MAEAAWLEICPSANALESSHALDHEVANGSPLGRVLASVSDPSVVKQKMPSGWQYSLRLSMAEAEELKATKIFRSVEEDHRSIMFRVPVSFRGVVYDLTLFIMK